MLYCCISIDVECDKGPQWIIKHPLQFTSVHDTIPNILEPCFRSVGARATYLSSPEVLYDLKSVRVLNTLLKDGAELGTHLHGEFIEPNSEYDTTITRRMQKEYSKDIEEQKILNLTNKFKHTFAFSPKSFRAGRFGLGPHSLTILEQFDYLVDSSVAPFSAWKNEIDFFGAPTQPYLPDHKDFNQKGDMDIVELPVTIGASWWDYIPHSVLKILPPTSIFWGSLRKYCFLNKKFTPIWLRPTFSSASQMQILIRKYLHRLKNTTDVYFNMMFHSVEFSANNSPYAHNQKAVNYHKKQLLKTLHYLSSLGVRFITLSEAANLFKDKHENTLYHRLRTARRS